MDGLHQPPAELALQEAQHFADALQRKAFPAQLPDDRNLCQIVERVEPPAAAALRRDDALLIPPLQLPRRDTGKRHDLFRSKPAQMQPSFNFRKKCFKHFFRICLKHFMAELLEVKSSE